jgi:pyruvate dehydrogenase E1 component alpha subunit
MNGVRVDGNDPIAMYAAAKAAADRARAGEGPTLLEAMTYRMLGHTFGSDFSYVSAELREEAAANDPMPRFRKLMLDRQVPEATLAAIEAEIEDRLDQAVEYALASPYPDVSEIRRDVFAKEIAA